jgi:hypothetical protein
LLSQLHYRTEHYDEAVRLADTLIAANRNNADAWLVKALSLDKLQRASDARALLDTASRILPADEFIRAAFEDMLISGTSIEDPQRRRAASWHFAEAAVYKKNRLYSQALFEYRRGLRINPDAYDRRDYAELLRLQGQTEQFVEELNFLKAAGKGDRQLDDLLDNNRRAIEGSLRTQWKVEPAEIKPHWNVAVFSIGGQSSALHSDAGAITASYIKDLLSHQSNIRAAQFETTQAGFAEAFRTARSGEPRYDGLKNVDYFLIVSVTETESDIALKAELHNSRTGTVAANFSAYRAGAGKLRGSAQAIVEQLASALPFRASLLRREGTQGLIDRGALGGVEAGAVYSLLKKGAPETASSGAALVYAESDITGTFTVGRADSELSSGTIRRVGFFDRATVGDEVLLVKAADSDANAAGAPAGSAPASPAADPELRELLRRLR